MNPRHDPHWKGGVDLPMGWDQDAPECKRCESDTNEPSGICLDCRDGAGEVFCAICKRWAVGAKGEEDACFSCLNQAP